MPVSLTAFTPTGLAPTRYPGHRCVGLRTATYTGVGTSAVVGGARRSVIAATADSLVVLAKETGVYMGAAACSRP